MTAPGVPAGTPGDDPRSDAELIARVRAPHSGNDASQAFGVLYARHQSAARGLARQLARSPSDADDLVAGAFTRMLEVLRGGGGPNEAFRAYLLTSVRHQAYDRTRVERRLEVTDDIGGVTGVDPGATVVPFQDPALAGLERSLAAQAFATLPERWQAVLWHLEIEGDTPADIAPLFGLTANAVSALGYRAREGLRQAYLQEHLASVSGRWDRRHRDTGERLGAYTRGGLSRRDAVRVEEHLAECEECRALADELREVNSGLLRSVVAPLVLGAGLVGYLASRGGAGTGLDATTGELAVAGGGVLGVLGAFGSFVVPPVALRRTAALPDGSRTPVGAVAVAGVLGLAGAVGAAAFVLGGGGAPPGSLPAVDAPGQAQALPGGLVPVPLPPTAVLLPPANLLPPMALLPPGELLPTGELPVAGRAEGGVVRRTPRAAGAAGGPCPPRPGERRCRTRRPAGHGCPARHDRSRRAPRRRPGGRRWRGPGRCGRRGRRGRVRRHRAAARPRGRLPDLPERPPRDDRVIRLATMTELPRALRRWGRLGAFLAEHGELWKFATVGAMTFVVDTAVFVTAKATVLEPKPVTAKILAVLIATIVGYVLNREWSFRLRGGRGRPHEAMLYFAVSGVAMVINAAPLGISRYVLDLAQPAVSSLTEHVADLVSAQVVGTLLAMIFRWWAFRRWVFPGEVGPLHRSVAD